MSETVPTAAPAAPVAAPAPVAPPAAAVAPVAPAPAAPVTPPVTAPVAPAAPAAAAPAADVDSLIPADPAPPQAVPQTEAEKIAAARALIKEADAAADPNSGKAWLLNDGVMGQGEKPGWFNTAKYRTVAAQAEAYSHLEPRFGAFVGAPKDGKYQYTPPEGVEVSLDHPVMQEFSKWAASKQLSQEGYNEVLNMLVDYEAAQAPNMTAIKGRLGENADARIAAVAGWGKANLGNEFQTLRTATSGANADAVFKVLEAVIAKTTQAKLPTPGGDTRGAQAEGGLEAIKTDHGKRNATGQLMVDQDPKYRAEIEKRYREFYAGQAQ